jgi:PPP family 3-phenylpropionic acid transporter
MRSLLKPYQWGSLYYLVYFLATGALLPYLNLYYESIGIQRWEIGILAGLPQVMYLFAAPLWAALADALHLHKRLLPLVMLATLPPMAMLGWASNFYVLALLIFLHAFCLAPVIPLADHAVLAMLGDEKHRYGSLRIWGAVGFGGMAWIMGLVAEAVGIRFIFVAYLALMALGALVAAQLPEPRLERTEPFFASLRRLAADQRWQGFLTAVFLAGITYSVITAFFPIFMKDLGAGEGLFGLSMAAAGLSELPVFFFSALLLKRWKPRGLLLGALALFTVRALFYSVIQDPRWGVVGMLLHGPTFSALWVAGVTYAGEIAPPGLGASAQSAFVATLFGLAGVTGSLLAGGLYDGFGPRVMFQAAGAAALLGFILFWLVQRRAAAQAAKS